MNSPDFHAIAKASVARAMFDFNRAVETETEKIMHTGGGYAKHDAEPMAKFKLLPDLLIDAISYALEEYHGQTRSSGC